MYMRFACARSGRVSARANCRDSSFGASFGLGNWSTFTPPQEFSTVRPIVTIRQTPVRVSGLAGGSVPRLAVRRSQGFGLGRIFLAQEDRQHYQREDREKLALPVLKGFKPEAAAPQVPPAGRGGQAPGDLLIHRCAPAPGQMQEEAPDEKDGKDDGQRVT